MYRYTFRVHYASHSLFKSGTGIEMEIRFYLDAPDVKQGYKDAKTWELNLIKKNPSLRLMGSTCIQCIEERRLTDEINSE